jgi:Immunoglobulin I-set domain
MSTPGTGVGASPKKLRFRRLRSPIAVTLTVVVALLMGTAGSASAAQRIDMKVLLLGTSTSESDFQSWQLALQREGVPFQTIITSPGHTPITAATLSDTLANGTAEAKYQAVIVSVGALPECTGSGCSSTLSASEWTALEEYEQKFNVRQLTGDIFPSATYGLNGPATSGALDGTQMTLTTEGKSAFPYLKGMAAMDTGTYGYEATPLSTQATGASFKALVSGPASSALVGIYTHSSGVQEMVETFNENQYQTQSELLRHGAVNWVTRGVYFGDQRNYLEADIDDNFLSDDAWSTATHETDYNPADALREQPADVETAAKWALQHQFRIDMLFNGGGSAQYQAEHGSDPLLTAFKKYQGYFGWISHTWDHPNIDIGCASQSYIESELNENNSWAASTIGLDENTSSTATPLGNDNPSVIITGEHSGLANLIPGNPGVVDPPNLESADPGSGGTLPAGTYVYAVTDDFSAGGGQSIASESAPVTVSGSGSVELSWPAVCHAAQFKVYRELSGSNEWKLIATVSAPSSQPPNSWFASPLSNQLVTGGGALDQTFTDKGTAGSLVSGLPSTNEAVESAYPQNPALASAFGGVGVKYFGSDASKPYPNPAIPGNTAAAYPAGATFTEAGAQAVPRYPTNIYYNTSTEAQEVDEFNTLYTSVGEGGKCVNSSVTTCQSKAATFADVVSDVDTNMFQHLMGNDPRPHYFHQPNMMGSPPAGPPTTGTPPATAASKGDGLFYSVVNPLLEQYEKYFNAPIEQPTVAQAGALLAEQSEWGANAEAGRASAYIEGNQVTIQNSTAGEVNLPLTGVVGVGSVYGGIQSGWTGAPAGASVRTAVITWPEAPAVTTSPVAKTVTAGESATFTAAASGYPAPTVQWQVSTNAGATFANDTADAGNTTGTLTVANTTVALNARQYRAVFTNTSGPAATSMAAILTVNPKEAPKITGNPVSKTVLVGEEATFTAAASGFPAPTVQWQVSTNGGSTFANDTTDTGNTTGTLAVVASKTTLSGRQYRAVFTNSTSPAATSTAATLTVSTTPEAPRVTTNPLSRVLTAGESAEFTAAASGLPPPSVQWQLSTNGGVTFSNDTTDAGSTTPTLTVAGTTVALSAHEYRAVFTNSVGAATTTPATLTVNPKPEAPGAGLLTPKASPLTQSPLVTSPPTSAPKIGPSAPAPVVCGVSPNAGGSMMLVTITGRNFTNVRAVDFGSKPAVALLLSSTQIFALAPSLHGTVHVVVKTASGSSTVSAISRFTSPRLGAKASRAHRRAVAVPSVCRRPLTGSQAGRRSATVH